jgi:hypothetical protein
MPLARAGCRPSPVGSAQLGSWVPMRVVLAEKPSVARELASFLRATARADGYFEGQGYQVTWALGHLATLKEPEDYDPALKRWSLETLPIVPEHFEVKLVEDKGARQQFAVIKRLFRSAEEIICATDAGREGELIFRYILELAGCTGKPARRLWLSSLTEAAIRDAFRRLRPLSDYDALYAAARCRSEADWIVGLNATRNYTVRYRSGGVLWSVGRVQTPVLAMIVRRDDEIRTFKPEPFWELLTRYREVTFKFAGERFAKEEDARTLLGRVQGHHHPRCRAQGGAGPAAAALRPDRVAAGHEPAVRDVGRRHAEGRPGALREQSDNLPQDRIAAPGPRHEGADPAQPGRTPASQAGRDREAGPRRSGLHRAHHRRQAGERPPRDHPDRQGAGGSFAGCREGLRRRRRPLDRRLVPRLREGGDERLRSIQWGAVPRQGGAGARARVDHAVPPEGR